MPAVTGTRRPAHDDLRPPVAPRPGRGAAARTVWSALRRRPAVAAVAVAAAGASAVVAHDGTPGWHVARVAAVVAVAVLTARAATRRQPGRRGVSATFAGAVATAVGIGLALPHLTKAGAGVVGIAGLALLVGGLALVAAGAVTILGALSGWWRLPAAAAITIVVGVASWTVGQGVAATNVPRPAVGAATPASRGLAYRDVELRATDGVPLSAWYVPSTNGAAVVLLHGAGSTRSAVLDQAVVLARHGEGVLLLDARGHGRSAGRAMDFGWYGDRDVGGAVAFLAQQPDVDPDRIGAVGMSMGGEEAIGAAAAVPGLRAVVAEGATNRVAGDKAWLSNEFGLRGALTEAVDAVTYAVADALTDARPPITLHDAVARAAPVASCSSPPAPCPTRRACGALHPQCSAGHGRAVGRAGCRPHRRAGDRAGGVGGTGDLLPRPRAGCALTRPLASGRPTLVGGGRNGARWSQEQR